MRLRPYQLEDFAGTCDDLAGTVFIVDADTFPCAQRIAFSVLQSCLLTGDGCLAVRDCLLPEITIGAALVDVGVDLQVDGALTVNDASTFFSDLTVEGKLTVGGAIDPTWLEMVQQAAVGMPVAGSSRLYFKADTSLYQQDEAGLELRLLTEADGFPPGGTAGQVLNIDPITVLPAWTYILVDADGSRSLDFSAAVGDGRTLYDGAELQSVLWDSRELIESTVAQVTLDWDAQQLTDAGGFLSVDWVGRYLYATDGTPLLGWADPTGLTAFTISGTSGNTSLDVPNGDIVCGQTVQSVSFRSGDDYGQTDTVYLDDGTGLRFVAGLMVEVIPPPP